MMKKGFTLIELLAVIVILAIIALIAVPIIMNIINDSKKQAALRSAENYLDAVSQAVAKENLNNEFNPSTCEVQNDGNLVCNTGNLTVKVDGEKPTSGTITFNNGKVETVTNLKYSDGYVSTDSKGNLSLSNDTVVTGNLMTTGQEFNSKIKTLANGTDVAYSTADTTIKSIMFLSNGRLPDGYTKETLQNLGSVDVSYKQDNSIMAYYNGNGTIYIYSEDSILGNSDMSEMFANCKGLMTLDVSDFNTSNVTTMYGMFAMCSSLTSLNLSNFDTSKVTNMYSMFANCSSLTTLDVSNFNTSNVTNMYAMFGGCTGLTVLDLSNFNTSNVTDMPFMFSGCTGLTSLDVSSFDTSKVTNMQGMFSGTIKVESLNVSNFDTSNVTNMQGMFSGYASTGSARTFDLSKWDTSKVTNMSGMFSGCANLTCIQVGDKWTTENADISGMFGGAGVSAVTTSQCTVSSS